MLRKNTADEPSLRTGIILKNGGVKRVSRLLYGARIAGCKVLGPGNRAVLWVFGCPRDCPGCIAKSFREGTPRETTVQEMAEWYLAQDAEGITISGGEPFEQAEALAELTEIIRREKDAGVIVYTGYLYEELLDRAKQESAVRRFLNNIDLLIDGPYLQERDHNQPYVGSDNQRLLPLTNRYAGQMSYYTEAVGRKVEIRLSEKTTLLVGVPGQDQREIWRRVKKLNDTNVET